LDKKILYILKYIQKNLYQAIKYCAFAQPIVINLLDYHRPLNGKEEKREILCISNSRRKASDSKPDFSTSLWLMIPTRDFFVLINSQQNSDKIPGLRDKVPKSRHQMNPNPIPRPKCGRKRSSMDRGERLFRLDIWQLQP